MTEPRMAYIFDYAMCCQECGEKAEQEGAFVRSKDPVDLFDKPEAWFCEECGEPLFPKLFAQATKNLLWNVDDEGE